MAYFPIVDPSCCNANSLSTIPNIPNMASSYTLQRVAGDGDVSYHVKLSAGGGRSDAAAGDQRKPILQQFPVSMLIHTRIMAIGNITATTFQCRFDLYVNWPEQMEGAVEFAQDLDEATLAGVSGDRAALAWQPLIRFPNAIEYTESRRLIFTDEVRRRIGQRTTVQGLFKVCSTGHGSAFPFDAVPLELVMQLGFEMNSKQQLYADKYRFAMNPEQPNLSYAQHDPEYSFWPARHATMTTTPLEAPQPISKFVVVMPAVRKWSQHCIRFVPLLLVLNVASLFLFCVPVEQLAPRLIGSLLLLLATVLAKLTVRAWPTTQQLSWLDTYYFGCFLTSFLVFVLVTTTSAMDSDPGPHKAAAVASVVVWALMNVVSFTKAKNLIAATTLKVSIPTTDPLSLCCISRMPS